MRCEKMKWRVNFARNYDIEADDEQEAEDKAITLFKDEIDIEEDVEMFGILTEEVEK
jgi:hypothetical protein